MHQQGGGGLGQQFGLHPPEMPPFSPAGSAAGQQISVVEAPLPISSRPPVAVPCQRVVQEQGSGGGLDEEALVAGEEGVVGNRWPRHETLALLKIRSDMDANFRDATIKAGPLWEEVSRKLAEEGYRRSSQKCKEKFDNLHKYYKRTKDSRAGRSDGKTYRFFKQLEALHDNGAAGASAPAPAPAEVSFAPPAMAMGMPEIVEPLSVRLPAEAPPVGSAGAAMAGSMPTLVTGSMSFSTSDSDSEESSDEEDSDDEGIEEMGGADDRGKRKRMPDGSAGSSDGWSGKMMRFFEGLTKHVMERQEAMQRRFLAAIEKRDHDRMMREEAWRRQEMARVAREQEVLAKARAMVAARDAAVLSFIQKITGQIMPMPSIIANAMSSNAEQPPLSRPHPAPFTAPAPAPSQPPKSHQQPPPWPQESPQTHKSTVPTAPQPQHQSSTDIVMTAPSEALDVIGGSGYDGSAPTRWPKEEVHALIDLRSNLDMRYQEAGQKGPAWDEISAGMRRMGYNRSSKRCKEKWENIKKYYKKVKDNNKQRPEDSKTCPYFHQLDALYRSKGTLSFPTGDGAGAVASPTVEHVEALTVAVPISQTAWQPHVTKNSGTSSAVIRNSGGKVEVGGSSGMQMQASNGSVPAAAIIILGETGGPAEKKGEDMMKEMMKQSQPQVEVQQQAPINSYNGTGGDVDSDSMDEDEDAEEDDDANKMQYEIQFQKQQPQPHHNAVKQITATATDAEEDDDASKMQYEIQFQKEQQQPQPPHNIVKPNTAAATDAASNPPGASAHSTATSAATTTAGSFLGLVQ